MRIWSLHPSYLDSKGLVALWRETLLAQKVLLGQTKGYKNHPQLIRFRATGNPIGAVAQYLRGVVDEAECRGYNFDQSKVVDAHFVAQIPVTSGQMSYEVKHLSRKLEVRDPALLKKLQSETHIKCHPLFQKVSGDIEAWEVVTV